MFNNTIRYYCIMLSEIEMRIITKAISSRSVSELSESTGYCISYVSERVSYLESLGLVKTTLRNRRKMVQTLHTSVFDAYKDLRSSYPHIDFHSMISPSLLQVCWFLDKPTSVKFMEDRLRLKRRRIYQILEELQSRGFVKRYGDRYVITERLHAFADFVRTVIRYEKQRDMEIRIPSASVIWSAPHESILSIGELEDHQMKHDLILTGLPRFSEHGLNFFTAGPSLYFHSDIREQLTPMDHLSHVLMADADTRDLSYCVLFYMKSGISPEELRRTSKYYGIEKMVDALTTFVETRGRKRSEEMPLPDRDEMMSLAKQYEVNF